jgi:hypothetical protein
LSAGAATVLAVALVALVCFLAGFVARTVTAQRVIDALESSVLSKIPAYDYLKQESASALGVAEIGEHPVVFVPMEGGWQLGVQTEALSGGVRARLARPAFRGGLFLFDGQRSTCRHQAGRCAQLPQAMRRGRFRDRGQLAGQGVAPSRFSGWFALATSCETGRKHPIQSRKSVYARS